MLEFLINLFKIVIRLELNIEFINKIYLCNFVNCAYCRYVFRGQILQDYCMDRETYFLFKKI